jgi:hypothetical protein
MSGSSHEAGKAGLPSADREGVVQDPIEALRESLLKALTDINLMTPAERERYPDLIGFVDTVRPIVNDVVSLDNTGGRTRHNVTEREV